ncbi:MAG: ion transporter [Bacilli bacterium]|nr:ion transporter [Bacilli bacterium]
MNNFRKKISDIINVWEGGSRWCIVYDVFMIIAIILGLLPLCFHERIEFFYYTDIVVAIVFIVDYLLRWLTADFTLRRGKVSFAIYPITPFAIIDLLCILPLLATIGVADKYVLMFRLICILRFVKFLRYSRSVKILVTVIRKYVKALLSIAVIMIMYLVLAALIMFNVEPETFPNFFLALYWSTVTMCTIGYGDIYPVTVAGRIVTMITSLFGLVIFALPTGFIAASFIKELSKFHEQVEKDKEYIGKIRDIEKKIKELEENEKAEETNVESTNKKMSKKKE